MLKIMLLVLWGIKKKYTVLSKIRNLVRNMKSIYTSELRAIVLIQIYITDTHIYMYTHIYRRIYTYVYALQISVLLTQSSNKCLRRRKCYGASEKTKLYHGK